MKQLLPTLALLLAAPTALHAQLGRTSQLGPVSLGTPPGPELWVSGYTSAQVHRFHPRNASILGQGLAAPGAQSIVQGPDGLIYVAAEESDAILRFDGTRALGAFISDDPLTPQDETGGLDGPTAAIFGEDGNLYVGSFNSDAVLLYDGQTGAYLRHFVNPGQGGLNGPDAGMVFGPDGHLYVPSFNSNRVLRYDGVSGANLGIFVNQFSGGLSGPRTLLFRPNGDLWVSSWRSRSILAYDSDGNFLRRVISLRNATGFAIGPDHHLLYVTSDQSNRVLRYNLWTETLVDTFIPSGTDGLNGATFLAFIQRRR